MNTMISPIEATAPVGPHPFLRRLQANAFERLNIRDHTVDLAGWVNEGFDSTLDHVLDVFQDKPQVVIMEVGSWKGASANRIAGRCKARGVDLAALVCIDTWLGAPEFYTWGLDDETRGVALRPFDGYPSVFYTFTKNTKFAGHHDVVVPFPISSLQAAEVLRHYGIKADAIYVDGSHESNAVYMDLLTFHEVLDEGGLMWGDDYSENWPGVQQAVNLFAEEKKLELIVNGVNWILRK